MPSPYSEKTQEPLAHAVLIQADPAGQPSAVGSLSPSDCYPVGPCGLYVAGGPVGPDVWFKDLEPLTHAVLIHADPAGQHAAAVGTLSPSDCCPVGPAGPYVAGGPVGPDDYLQALEPCEQLVLDHADPAGQHAFILDATLDGGLVEKISDWEPAARPVPDITLDGRLREGNTYLEHSAPGVSLDSGLTEGASCLEPLEQSVLSSSLAARRITEKLSDWKPVINPVQGITPDGRPMEGTAYPEHSALGVSLDSGLRAGMSSIEPMRQSVLNTLSVARPEAGLTKEPQIGSRWHFRFQALPWTVDLGRGILTRSIRLWGCPWTVDSWRGIRCRLHDLTVEAGRNLQTGMRWHIRFRTLTWTVDLWRGIPTWSHRLWGYLWTVDSWR